jgi:hypothetical protein
VDTVVAFLPPQCSTVWAGLYWPREDWLCDFWRSETGSYLTVLRKGMQAARRDVTLIPAPVSLTVLAHYSDPRPVEPTAMWSAFAQHEPKALVFCGLVAYGRWLDFYERADVARQRIVERIPAVVLPHPLSSAARRPYYEDAGRTVATATLFPFHGIRRLKVIRGKHDWEETNYGRERELCRDGREGGHAAS